MSAARLTALVASLALLALGLGAGCADTEVVDAVGEADSDADGDADGDSDSDTDSDTDVDTDGDADADSDTGSDTDNDIDTDADSDADVDSDADADSDTDADADGDTDSDGCPFDCFSEVLCDLLGGVENADYECAGDDVCCEPDNGGDADADSDTDADSDADTESDTGADTETETVADCPYWCLPLSTCLMIDWIENDSYSCGGSDICCEPDFDTDTGTGSDSDADTDADTDTDCVSCTASLVGGCASDAVVVGHYEGGDRTVCVEEGDSSSFRLALMSYEVSSWTLSGATWRVEELAVYGYDGVGTISGNDSIPTTIQDGWVGPCNPYDYASSMGDCPAHTGWTGCMFDVPQDDVCHQELGLSSECSYPDYTCLSIDP